MKAVVVAFIVVIGFSPFDLAAQVRNQKNSYTPEFVKAKSVAELFVDMNPFTDPSFFKIYAEYRAHQKREYRCSFLMLNNLAMATEIISEKEAFDCINTFLSIRSHEQHRYFQQMLEQVNFAAALDFLLVEARLNPNESIMASEHYRVREVAGNN